MLRSSAVFSTFPWRTDFLIEPNKEVTTDVRTEGFFKALTQFEEALQQTCCADAADLRGALAIVSSNEANEMPTLSATIPKPTRARVCHVLSLYRLVDVLHAIHNSSSTRNPRHSRMPSIGVKADLKAWPMSNWVLHLTQAQTNFDALATFRLPTTVTTGPVTPCGPDDLTLQTNLFKDLYIMSQQTKGFKMLYNVQLAALHLSFLLRGYNENSALALPDLGERGGSLALNADQLEYGKALVQEYSMYKLRYPLHAALLLSPLILLNDKKLPPRCMDQDDMVKASKALGNCKPVVLLQIENAMWRTLFSIATGYASAYSALQEFFLNVPWAEVHTVSSRDRDFFLPDANALQSPISLLCLQNEDEVDAIWPLASLRRTLRNTGQQDEEMPPAGNSSIPSDHATLTPPEDRNGEDNSRTAQNTDEMMSGAHGEDEPMSIESDAGQQGPSGTGMNARDDDTMASDTDNRQVPNREDESTHGSSNQDQDPTRARNDGCLRRSNRAITKRIEAVPQRNIAKSVPKRKARPRNRVTSSPPPNLAEYLNVRGGSYFEPIDLDLYTSELEITYRSDLLRGRLVAEQCQLFSPLGEPYRFLPEFHHNSDLAGFYRFEAAVRNNFVDGKARHVSAPEQSCFKVLSNGQYTALTTNEIQNILRTKHIVITDIPVEPTEFDARGLGQLTNLSRTIHFQDQSIKVTDERFGQQLCTGTLRDILRAAESEVGPILNALSFPLALSGIHKSTFSSEIEAWRATEGSPFCKDEANYPKGDMRWGLAGTRGARHWVHIDSDGLGTFIDVKCGGKWWIVFSPPEDQDKYAFASTDLFLDNFDVTRPDWGREPEQEWISEAVHLTAGTRLIMRPNTPHAVFTTDHSIVMGGHFYSRATLQDSFFGIIHCFMADAVITNVEHSKTRTLLLRMMQHIYKYFTTNGEVDESNIDHIPDLLDNHSFIDVLTLCNLCYLANVLDFRTYSFPMLATNEEPSPRDLDLRERWDYNALSVVDREHITYVRGLARNFITWLSCNFNVTFLQSQVPVADFQKDFAGRYLLQQACTILNYKKLCEDDDVQGAKHCTFVDVERQMDLLFGNNPSPLGSWQEVKKTMDSHTTLRFGDMTFTVQKKGKPDIFKETDPVKLGTSGGDKLYKKGCEAFFPSSKSNIRPLSADAGTDSDEDPLPQTQAGKRKHISPPTVDSEPGSDEDTTRAGKRKRASDDGGSHLGMDTS